MNILNVAIKEIKSATRERRTLLFMLAFPIVLMLILGTALSNAFSSNAFVGEMQLLYKINANQPQLTQAWQSFSHEIEKQGVRIDPAEAGMNGRDLIKDGQYTAYVEIDAEGLKFYGNSKQSLESNILQGMLTAFADRYNLAASALKSTPSEAKAVMASIQSNDKFVNETSLDPDKTPDAMDYYAVSMTTMIALYSALSGSFLFRSERTRQTATRLMAAPISKGELFAGKVIGCTVINLMCVSIIILVSKFAFHANWGDHMGLVFLILTAEVLLAVSLGLGVSYLVQGEKSRSVIMIFTQIASFVGGAYFPFDDSHSIMGIVMNLSPLHWANDALMNIIYSDNVSAAWPTIGINVAIAAAFLLISALIMRKREAL
ncbi:ABC transporter permease [Cohnella herbarum]|uniref:ABC transporter permease n=1 Tax=Cohnella herbarum TaxID=2728023 RepID=A0A7Z2VMV1_9BACL|nr:ABC transporter permease [Cohnella herbarum]QJD86178.1 ABC transporter permease [Cohnella herbarum]